MPTLLIVDDSPENLTVLSELLLPFYKVRAVTSGERALKAAMGEPRPDLILLDVMMPEMDGYDVIKRLRADSQTADIPVIFVTAMNTSHDEEYGLCLGAADYITKPIKPAIALARIKTQLELKAAYDWLQDRNHALEAEVARRMKENILIQDVSIRALARLAETRDPETGNHLRRTQQYIHALCLHLCKHPRFSGFLTAKNIDLLVKSAPLHDIGKVGIPDTILLKPDKLDEAEWEIMKMHTLLGFDAIEQAERDTEKPVEFFTFAKIIARHHHEKWDGSGYPDGLVGEDIPIAARLMALADVFDALITQRPYKPPMDYAHALDIIIKGRGTHFDPDLVDACVAQFDMFIKVAERNRDQVTDVSPNIQRMHTILRLRATS